MVLYKQFNGWNIRCRICKKGKDKREFRNEEDGIRLNPRMICRDCRIKHEREKMRLRTESSDNKLILEEGLSKWEED